MIRAVLIATLALCPVYGTIDRIEDATLVVLGQGGVRLIARSEVQSSRPNGPREGDRIEPNGPCRARGPRREETQLTLERLRAMEGGIAPRK